MKKNYIFTNLLFSLIAVTFFSQKSIAQTEKEKIEILAQYDLEKIRLLQNKLKESKKAEKEKVLKLAKLNNWPLIKENPDGSFDQLMGLYPDNSPKYFALDNADASKSTRANTLNSGGFLGLTLNGQNMTGGVWDGGPVRTTHQEFGGRISVGDGVTVLNNNSFHGTHVTGTISASGVQSSAKGMAPMANVKTFDWDNDEEEVLVEILDGLLLSNHSYGTPIANTPGAWYPGAYTADTKAWDEIHYVSPYYLMIVSAGNDGNNLNSNPSTTGFDKLMGNKTGKNNLVIANAQDASVSSTGQLISVQINSSSSQGPADDLRIKPDISGNGTGLYSCSSVLNSTYTTLSGTSMASPNVMGTLLLVQQHHNNLYQNFMRAATLKALACHTADDAGNPGPDAKFGWGLLNAKEAANVITNNGLSSWISEEKLNQGQTYSMTVKSVANTPLIATISWTDVPGVANTGVINDLTPALINDLDIRISQAGSTFYPWKLQSSATQNATRTSDNYVDTVESIKIDNPNGGDYTITISHKGTLVDGNQRFGLIVSGVSSSFGIVPLGYSQIKCSNQSATFNFNFKKTSGANVNLTSTNVPNGANVTFSNNNLSTNGTFSMTVSNLTNVIPGEYNIGVVGTNGSETETRYVTLRVYSNLFTPISIVSPTNGQTGISSTVILNWDKDVNAEEYTVQVATDVSFNSIFTTDLTTESTYTLTNLANETVYYWRVIPSNRCGISSNISANSFQTGILNCGLQFAATDYSDASIGIVPNSLASVPVNVSGGFIIGDVNVNMNISHTWVQDMKIYLDGPASIGSPRVTLFFEPCAGEDNIDATLDDAGFPLNCSVNPAISGIVIPYQSLSVLNGLQADGEWKLQIVDDYDNDGGSINSFSLDFCNIVPIQNTLNFVNNGINVLISSTKTIVSNDINASSPSQSSTSHVFTIVQTPTLGQLKKNGNTLVVGSTFTQEDVNQNVMTYVNAQTSPALDSFKANILNASSGWLSNRVIPISIQNQLGFETLSLDRTSIFPNPSNGIVTIQLPTSLSSETKMNLVDLQGRLILTKNSIQTTEQLNLESLQEGVYIINLESGNQKISRKIVLKR